MQNSVLKTVTVPGAGTGAEAVLVADSDAVPMRVLVDNVGATPMRLAVASSSIASATVDGSNYFQLQAGQHRYLVLAPKQRLFAISIGAAGRLSIHTSDALPFDLRG